MILLNVGSRARPIVGAETDIGSRTLGMVRIARAAREMDGKSAGHLIITRDIATGVIHTTRKVYCNSTEHCQSATSNRQPQQLDRLLPRHTKWDASSNSTERHRQSTIAQHSSSHQYGCTEHPRVAELVRAAQDAGRRSGGSAPTRDLGQSSQRSKFCCGHFSNGSTARTAPVPASAPAPAETTASARERGKEDVSCPPGENCTKHGH